MDRRAGSRPGGAGRGVPDAARTPGPCVFRPDPVFFDRTLCFSTGPCVFRAEPVSLALCFSGRKQVSLARSRCQRACVKRAGHVSSACVMAREHVPTGMCQRAGACVLGCKCSISSLLRDAGPLPVRAPAGPGGASRDAAGASGPCVFRPDPVFFDRTLCFSGGACVFGPVFFGAEAGVSGGEHVSSAGVMTREQVSTACVKRAGHVSSACVMAREHVPTGMCQRACANGHVPMRRAGVNGQVLSAGVVGLERGPAQSAAARAGAAKRRPSSRSSRPPWPGISRPLSFLPEARFQ